MKNIYIIAGPNGAGKTTAYREILKIYKCEEFVNADEIAKGLSPLNPDDVQRKSGRMMLQRIEELLKNDKSFAIETTLSGKGNISLIKKAKNKGYQVTIIFLYLNAVNLAIDRVKIRVQEGGHNIPKAVIKRRYDRGLKNLFKRYMPIVNSWSLVDNSNEEAKEIARGTLESTPLVNSENIWQQLKTMYI